MIPYEKSVLQGINLNVRLHVSGLTAFLHSGGDMHKLLVLILKRFCIFFHCILGASIIGNFISLKVFNESKYCFYYGFKAVQFLVRL